MSPSRVSSVIYKYGASLVVYVVAFFLTDVLWQFIQPSPVPLFFAAIVAAFWGGFGPGLFISIVSALTIDFFFVAPFDHFEWTPQNVVRIGVFVTVSSLISWLNGTRKRLIDERGRLLVQVQGFNRDLQREVSVATKQLADANEALLETQQTLARSERMAVVGQMAASLAHEIGSPLNAISGHLELLDDSIPRGAESKRRVIIIRQQLDFIVGTVKRLLEWTHNRKLETTTENISELIAEVIWLVTPTLDKHGITARLVTARNIPELEIDRKRIQHVFLNLINNSIEAMPGGGQIEISIRCRDEDGIEILFEDSGEGIHADAAQHLFKPMWTTKPTGSGFGLSIVREILNQHGGEIQVSGSEGGARFVLTLPLSKLPQLESDHQEEAVLLS